VWTARQILDTLSGYRDELRAMGVRKIGLFGSYGRDTPGPDSDMDFVVTLERPSFDDYMAIKMFLEDHFGCRVDLVIEDSIKPRLRTRILGEAIYVQEFTSP
jgi:uncharacterized protein